MKEEKERMGDLPENAFRELKEGEEYTPLMHPDKTYPEVSAWSVTWGVLMAILFSAAAAYLGLKVGQVFEAAIPIAIIGVGLSTAFKRKNALGENVIIQSIGASSGVIVAGAIFYIASTLHFANKISRTQCHLHASVYELIARRYFGDTFPHSISQIFCIRHARKISFPRSHSHYTSAYFGRKRWRASKTSCVGRTHRRALRLPYSHFWHMGRRVYIACYSFRDGAC